MDKKVNAPTIKLIYDRRKQASKVKPGYVEFSIYYDYKQTRIATGIMVYPTEWSDGTIIRRHDKEELNARLLSMHRQLNRVVSEGMERGTFSIDTLKGFSFVQDKKKQEKQILEIDFYEWLEKKIDERPIRESTRKQHKVMMRKLKESGLVKDFSDLTTANMKRWDNYLHTSFNMNNELSRQTTIHGYHKRLKPYIREAYALGLIPSLPYTALQIPRGKADGIKYLRESERDLVEYANVSGSDEIARDMFIFACYTGLAYSDLVKIKKEDIIADGGKFFIEDKRTKTDSAYRLTLLPKAVEILKKYDYNLNRLSNQKCNVHLKIIAGRVGIDKNLTMHMGRHTFATWALRKGVRIEAVSKMLAHHDIKTTQVYAKVLQVRFHRQPGKTVRGRGMKKRWLVIASVRCLIYS